MSKDNVILNIPIGDESNLGRRDNFMEKRFQSIGQKLGDDFVNYSAKAYRSELMSKMKATDLWNESKESVILLSRQMVKFEEIPNEIKHIRFNNTPVFLIE